MRALVFLCVFMASCVSAYTRVAGEIDPCACACVYLCLYELLCLGLRFSVFVCTVVLLYVLAWLVKLILKLALAFVSVRMASCVCAYTRVAGEIDPCACACVYLCLYGLLCLGLRFSVFVCTAVLLHVLAWLVKLILKLALAFVSVRMASCVCAYTRVTGEIDPRACAWVYLCLCGLLYLGLSFSVFVRTPVLPLVLAWLVKLILKLALAFISACMNSCACTYACAYASVTSEIDPWECAWVCWCLYGLLYLHLCLRLCFRH